MNYDEYGDPITSGHKRRLAKVTMYLEVPAVNPETEIWYTEDELCKQIEDNLPEGFVTTSWSDINISDIESDDPADFEKPVGYLAPDGKFFLIETEENGLTHLALARRVHDLYKSTFIKIRNVKSPNRANSHDVGTIFFIRYFINNLYSKFIFIYYYETNLKNKL